MWSLPIWGTMTYVKLAEAQMVYPSKTLCLTLSSSLTLSMPRSSTRIELAALTKELNHPVEAST